MFTQDDLLSNGYTQEEIDSSTSSVVNAGQFAAGMPLKETLVKNMYILSALSSGGGGMSSVNIGSKFTNNEMQFACIKAGVMNYTLNGSVWTNSPGVFTTNYDLTGWNTALVVIKSAGGGGAVDATSYAPHSCGQNSGIITYDLLKVVPVSSHEPTYSEFDVLGCQKNNGGIGREFSFLVSVSGMSIITITLGVGGNIGASGSVSKFGTLISINGGISGIVDNTNDQGSIDGTKGADATMRIIKIN